MAGAADHKGFAPLPDHERRPGGLGWTGLAEAREFPDLVDNHLARFLAQFTASREQPGDYLLAGVDDRLGDAVGEHRVPVSCKRYPAEPCDQCRLAVAFDSGFKAHE